MRGARVQLRIETSEGTISLSASVLRSLVSTSKGIPRYQAAVAFDRPLRILDHDSKTAMDTEQAIAVHPPPSETFPSESNASFPDFSQSEDLLMIAASWALNLRSEQYAGMREELELNEWVSF